MREVDSEVQQMKTRSMKWVKSRFQKSELNGQTVKFSLPRFGAEGNGKFDVLGPNEAGLIEISIVHDTKLNEQTMKMQKYRLNAKEADRIECCPTGEMPAFCCIVSQRTMTMKDYLNETRHAASSLIDAFTAEWKAHKNAVIKYNGTAADFRKLGGNSLAAASSNSKIALLAGAFEGILNQYNGLQKYHLERLEKVPSTSILCGALLQIAKQGLSSVHGQKTKVPAGRAIGATTLREVIWEGRNQAMHFEEGKHKPDLIACFQGSEAAYAPRFSLSPGKNLALYVIDVLGWHTLAAYEADMMSLN